MTKLSAAQIGVLEDMQQGWVLRSGEHCLLSRVRSGHLETRTVRSDTVFALKEKGYIEVSEKGFPLPKWKLTGKP